MKAMVYHRYGSPDNLALQDVERPVVTDDTLLVRVRAASVNWIDHHLLTGTPFLARLMAGGLLRPKEKILGVDLAGRVGIVGRGVTQFQPDDEVYGNSRGRLKRARSIGWLGDMLASR